MFKKLVPFDTFFWIDNQHSSDYILDYGANPKWKDKWLIVYLFE